jgi:uncharacterized repeat protein (TIGR04076 family)
MNNDKADIFTLYNLKVEVVGNPAPTCSNKLGDYFLVEGENIIFSENNSFSLYSLAALLPLLPAKQRETNENDWMTTDTEVACPDPSCGSRFRITRTGKQEFHHNAVSAIPLPKENK